MVKGLKWRWIFGAIPLGLYVFACTTHAYQFAQDRHHFQSQVLGINLLLIGWLGLPFGQIGWYANLLFFPALILFLTGKFRISWWLAFEASAIGATSLFGRTLTCSTPHGWTDIPILSYGPGLYAWLGAFLVLFLSATVAVVASPSASPVQDFGPSAGQN